MFEARQRGAPVELGQFEVIGLLLGQHDLLRGGSWVRLPVRAKGICHAALDFCHAGVVRGEVDDVRGCHGWGLSVQNTVGKAAWSARTGRPAAICRPGMAQAAFATWGAQELLFGCEPVVSPKKTWSCSD